jgi:hypothetical protein
MSARDSLTSRSRAYCEALVSVANGCQWVAAWHAGYPGSEIPPEELSQKQKNALSGEAWRQRKNPQVRAYIAELKATKAREKVQREMSWFFESSRYIAPGKSAARSATKRLAPPITDLNEPARHELELRIANLREICGCSGVLRRRASILSRASYQKARDQRDSTPLARG